MVISKVQNIINVARYHGHRKINKKTGKELKRSYITITPTFRKFEMGLNVGMSIESSNKSQYQQDFLNLHLN